MGEQEGSYSALTASALIFNIIVGMGLWALPKLLYESGTIVAFTILGLSGLFNCIVSTFINELQGSSNAIRKLNLSSKVISFFPLSREFFVRHLPSHKRVLQYLLSRIRKFYLKMS